MKDLSLDLVSLRAAYDNGLDPHTLIDLVYDRIEAANDPGIFIALRSRADVHEEIGATRTSGGASSCSDGSCARASVRSDESPITSLAQAR